MRRKIVSFTAAAVCGILYADLAGQKQEMIFIILSVAAVLLLFSAMRISVGKTVKRAEDESRKRRIHFYKILAAGFLAGVFLVIGYEGLWTTSLLHDQTEVPCRYSAKVCEIEERGDDSYQLYLRVGSEKVLCSYYHEISAPWNLVGRTITFDAVFTEPRGAGNPRTFDYRRYLRSEGIRHIAVIDKFQLTDEKPAFPDRVKALILRKREGLIEELALTASAEGLIRGMLFGDTSKIEESLYEDFRRNGTAHVLAVSGLHVGMLYGLYRKLYKRWRRFELTAVFVLMLFIYGSAALWSVSVRRAVILVLLSLGAELLKRRYDLLTALSVAAMTAIGRNPWVIFGTGFQMSFLAVLSLAFLMPVLERHIGETPAVVIAVQTGLLPYIAYTFNYVSVTGFFCNFPVVMLVSILVPAAAAGFFIYLAAGLMIPGMSLFLEGLCQAVAEMNTFFGSFRFLTSDIVSPPLWMIWGFYLFTFTFCSEHFFVSWRRRDSKSIVFTATVTIVVMLFSTAAGASPFDKADYIFVDVGQGDCLHIRTEEGKNLLIDGGGKPSYNIGKQTLKPYLLKNRIARIDLAAATHLHMDHYLGLVQLADCYPVRNLITEGKAGWRFRLGEKEYKEHIDILWPEKVNPDTDDENLNSLIFKVRLREISVLVTGDITEEGERMLLKRYEGTEILHADILKIAHHGSAYSTCDEFLEAVNPSVAVISVGKNNYGHPSEKVIEKLQKKGIMVFRTDLCGAVGIINEKGRIRICTENP